VLHSASEELIYALWRPSPTDEWNGGYYPVQRLIGKPSRGGAQHVEYCGGEIAAIPLRWQTLRVIGRSSGVCLPPFCHLRSIETAHIAAAYSSRPQPLSSNASPSASRRDGSSSRLPLDPASAEAQAETAWANPPCLPRPAPRGERQLRNEGEEEEEECVEEGEITESRSSAQAAADYAAQLNPAVGACFAAAFVAASALQHEAAAGDSADLVRISGEQAELLAGWGSLTDTDAESVEGGAVSSPVAGAAGTAPGTSQGESSADFGVGSTVLRRNVRNEFEIYTISGLTNHGDKVGSSAPGGRDLTLRLSATGS